MLAQKTYQTKENEREKTMTNKYIPTFEQFLNEAKGETNSYAPPKYVAQPAEGDKGYALVSAAFNSQKPYFKPGIKSSNQQLEDHDFDKEDEYGDN